MRKARALRQGDTIGIVAPSSPFLDDAAEFDTLISWIEEQGFHVIVADNCREQYGYLAGKDEARVQGVNRMFADDAVRAVICMRGGYGAQRILDRIDYKIISEKPKIFLGYSDITAIHAAIQERCGLITFHGPMPASDWRKMDDFTRNSLMRALTASEPLGEIQNPEEVKPICIQGGSCTGPLVGGNLSLIESGIGTPYALNPEGKILLLEDVHESIENLDSMLMHLLRAGFLEQCTGFVLGTFTSIPEEEPSLTLEEVVQDILVPLGKPILANVQIGHIDRMITVPLGAMCKLDASSGSLCILESALIP